MNELVGRGDAVRGKGVGRKKRDTVNKNHVLQKSINHRKHQRQKVGFPSSTSVN